MAGTGLVSLAVFSSLVMKETIRKREILGILFILGAAALIGLFFRESPKAEILLNVLVIVIVVVLAVYILLWLALRRQKRFLGILIGVFAGILSGFVPVFQKVATSPYGRASALIKPQAGGEHNLSIIGHAQQVLLNPYALLWIVLSLGSMVVIQFAYKHDRAIRIIPAFSANYILVPVILGVLCFRETLHPMQWMGVALILVGILLVTMPRVIIYERPPVESRKV
jgi:drug/metabolite transporter (DMT)-like permease